MFKVRSFVLTALALLAFVVPALAQTTPELPAPPPTALTPMQWITVSCAVVGAFGIFMTAVGQGLKLLGTRYPALEATAEHFLAWGADVQKAVALVQSSTMAKRAKLAHAAAARYAEDPTTTSKMFPSDRPPPANDPFPPPPGNPRAGFALVGPMAAIALVGILSLLALPGCAWFAAHPKVAPDLQATEQCVVAELQKDEAAGDTPLVIGIDLGATCGPDALKVLADSLAKAARTGSPRSRAVMLARKP